MKRRIFALLLAMLMVLNPIVGLAEGDGVVEILEDVVDTSVYEFDKESQTITGYIGTETDIVIPSVIDGEEVLSIGTRAFRRKGITSVSIPEGIKNIESLAFNNNSLEELVLPSTIETVGDQAFSLNNIKALVINDGLKVINQGTFSRNALESIEIPSSVRRIERMAFGANSSLREVVFNEGLDYIGQQAFTNCKLLAGTIEIPSTVHTVMTSAFSGTVVTKVEVRGDGDTTALLLKSGLTSDLNEIEINNPLKEVTINFNTFGCDEKENNVYLGTLSLNANNEEELKAEIEKNLKFRVVGTYINSSNPSGESDILKEFPIIWDYDVDFSKSEFVLNGHPEKLTRDDFPPIDGYTAPNPEGCKAKNVFHLNIKLEETAHDAWNSSDFIYDQFEYKGHMQVPVMKWGIKGLSESGKSKVLSNKDLVIPKTFTMDIDGENVEMPVEGIINGAFSNLSLDSVVFPETFREYDFIIEASAFSKSGLKSITLSEGIKSIGPNAFRDNELESVYIPSTVLAIGNSAFQSNKISSLEFSDDVQQIQIDNYAFSNNQLKEVNLPYSIFKFLKYVFKANPGMEKLAESELDENDPTGTGVVYLYTRNKAHLATETYIALSPYHKIINVSEDVDRDKLWNAIVTANAMDPNDYKEEDYDEFTAVLSQSKTVFKNADSTQEEIDTATDNTIEAIAKLRASSADKTKLRDLITQAEELVEELFEPESYSVMKEALDAARIVSKDKYATEDEVDAAFKALKEAIDNLVISENAYYTVEDFIYEGNTILGFSETGVQKFKINKDVYLPDESTDGTIIEVIGEAAFKMPDSEVEYGTDVVESPNGIKTIRLPSKLKRIESDALRVNNISSIDLPETVEYIGDMALNGNKLKSLVMPDSIKELGNGAFSLNQLTDVRLSKSLTNTGDGILSRNIHLKNIELHEGLEVIGASAFMGCPLTELNIPSTVTEIKSRAFSSHRLTKLTVPGNVKVIGNYAFEQNKKFRTLTSVDLRNGIEEIGNYAFRDGLITETQLPKSLVKIGNYSFRGNLDSDKNEVVAKLYTSNKDHLEFNNSTSLKYQEVIYDENVIDKDLLEKLEETIKNAESINKDDYTDETYKILEDALKSAKEALEGELTDEIIESAIKEINEAVEGLKVKPVKPVDPTPSVPSKPTTPSKPSKPSIPSDEDDKTVEIESTRIAGENRHETAIEISRNTFDKADTVVLVSGSNFADALTAQPLTSIVDGPLLLSGSGENQRAVLEEIQRLGAKNIIVVGGENSVSEDELDIFEDISIERTAGLDRYDTAEKVARLVLEQSGNKGKVIIADGRNYPDALTISPYATKEGLPILLSENNNLSEGQKSLIDEYSIKEALIIGGLNSVGSEIEKLFDTSSRIGESDRYETAKLIAEKFFKNSDEVFIASGENFPDALAVSYYAARKNAPVLLVQKDSMPKGTAEYLYENDVEKVVVIGGPSTISENAIQELIAK